MPGPGWREAPLAAGEVAQGGGAVGGHVEVAGQHDDVLRLCLGDGKPGGAQQLGFGEPLVPGVARAVQIRDQAGPARGVREPHRLHDPALLRPGEPRAGAEPQGSRLAVAKAARVQGEGRARDESQRRPDEDRVSLARERRAQQALVGPRQAVAERRRDRDRPDPRPSRDLTGGEEPERPGGYLLHAEHVGVVGGREADHLGEVTGPLRGHRVPVEEVPAPDEHEI